MASPASAVIACASLAGVSTPPQPAVVHNGRCWLLGERFSVISQLIEHWSGVEALQLREKDSLPLSAVRLHAPLAPSCTVFCIGKNYLDHVNEVSSSLPGLSAAPVAGPPAKPIVFTKSSNAVCASGDAILLPPSSSQVDYEGEVVVVIGKAGRCIPRALALEHVFGVTIADDVSARDLQRDHGQWFLGKNADTFCPCGPWIVPGLDPSSLELRTFVNGELRQSGNTSQLIFGVAQLIETISAGITLRPGDVILTGTPAGVGAGFKPPRWLAPGDVVRVEVSDVGVLENTVEAYSKL
jgi:2-keto-4-pentenoate hydratase/2-oxohepta-3-ene-1,7-dioic acid hydratase in catechol pathway